MNLLTNTPAIFLNLEKGNILLVLYTKIPKLNDKENIDIGLKCYKRMILHQKQYQYCYDNI